MSKGPGAVPPDIDIANAADLWRISVAVSHASNGQCQSFTGNDYECVVTSTVLTR